MTLEGNVAMAAEPLPPEIVCDKSTEFYSIRSATFEMLGRTQGQILLQFFFFKSWVLICNHRPLLITSCTISCLHNVKVTFLLVLIVSKIL